MREKENFSEEIFLSLAHDIQPRAGRLKIEDEEEAPVLGDMLQLEICYNFSY